MPRAMPRRFSAAGFMDDSPVARFYRDAKALEIGEGTSEIQRHRHLERPGAPGRNVRRWLRTDRRSGN